MGDRTMSRYFRRVTAQDFIAESKVKDSVIKEDKKVLKMDFNKNDLDKVKKQATEFIY